MYNLLKRIVYPNRCPICDKVVKGVYSLICENCYKSLEPLEKNLCFKCGKKVAARDEYCKDCSERTLAFDAGYSLYEYKDVAMSLYRFKYTNRQEYAEFYGKEMAKHFREKVKAWNPDGVIPIPIHKKRENLRGYNQAFLIAKVFAKELKLPIYHKLIVREKETMAQKKLNYIERQNNLKKAFKICQNDVKLDTIILIDDIYTTGATINEVAQVCQEVGIKKIYYLALAIGQEK